MADVPGSLAQTIVTALMMEKIVSHIDRPRVENIVQRMISASGQGPSEFERRMMAAYDAGFEEGRWVGPPVGNPRPAPGKERDYRELRGEAVQRLLTGPIAQVQ